MKIFDALKRLWICTTIVLITVVTATTFPVGANEQGTEPQSAWVKPRAPEPWHEMVAERQAAYRRNPTAPQFRRDTDRLSRTLTVTDNVTSANETDMMEGVLTRWVCTSDGNADNWDLMWMAIIAEAVRAGAQPYVYLVSALRDDDATTLAECSAMLEAHERVSADDVEWIQGVPANSIWLKDYGPLFVRDIATRDLSIEDAKYYSNRPRDDVIPRDFAARVSVPVSDLGSEFANNLGLYFEGGNFLPNGDGICIISSVVLGANPHYSEAEIRAIFRAELGCTELVIVQALDDWATGHVDMWLAWADRHTLVVGEYRANQDPVNRAIIEANIDNLLTPLVNPRTGDPIELVRMPMPSNCPDKWALHRLHLGESNASLQGWANGTWPGHWYKIDPLAERGSVPTACPSIPRWGLIWRTYLNVLFVNDTVVVPVYRQHDRYEQEALEIWRSLGFDVRPVLADMIAKYSGEIHCIAQTMSSR